MPNTAIPVDDVEEDTVLDLNNPPHCCGEPMEVHDDTATPGIDWILLECALGDTKVHTDPGGKVIEPPLLRC